MELLKALGPYVPLLQTLLWVLLFAVVLKLFYGQLREVIAAVRRRVETGSSLKAGPVELGEDLRGLPYIGAVGSDAERVNIAKEEEPGGPEDWEKRRIGIYDRNRGLFLAHVIEPSKLPNQEYEIFIYLIRHKSSDFSDVTKADFFFGHMWGNEIFHAEGNKGLIGVSTSAYAPFLCTCRITFTDGKSIDLHRYVDFEMGRVFHTPRAGRADGSL